MPEKKAGHKPKPKSHTAASSREAISREPIAVVGIGALFPGAQNLQQYWQNIFDAKDLMRQVPSDYWRSKDFYSSEPGPDRVYTDRGAFIDNIDFDVLASGIPPSNLRSTDASQLLALHVAQQLVQSAKLFEHQEDLRNRTSVILGIAGATQLMSEMSARLGEPIWRKVLLEAGFEEKTADELVQRMLDHFNPWQETTFPGLLGNVVAGRIANRLDLHGTNSVVDAACASSLSALSMAMGELQLGHSDIVITGGVDALNHPLMYMCFAQTGALSHSGDCRPFSDHADGTMMGEGVGLLAIRRLSDAEKDGNSIYAIIRGSGSSSDGLSKSVYAPRAEGQSMALRRAYDAASYDPHTVELVEAHGTATVAGDAAEFAGLKAVFETKVETKAETTTHNTGANDKQWCALGSVKSQIGHTKGAAGSAGLIKSIMALHQKVLPATIKVERENPKLDLANSPFYLNTRTRPWIRDTQHPRRASVSALGFGGSNFHVTLEEYRVQEKRPPLLRHSPVEAVLLGGEHCDEVAQQCRDMIEQCSQPQPLSAFAYNSQQQDIHTQAVRVVIIASDTNDLCDKLKYAVQLFNSQLSSTDNAIQEFSDNDVFISINVPLEKTVFIFPGQGSQYINMGSDLAMFHFEAQQVWDAVAESGPEKNGPHQSVFPKPVLHSDLKKQQESFLQQTQQTQPALGACSLAQLKLLDLIGVNADAVAGHSSGEIVALHAAGVLNQEMMMRVTWQRGALMQACADKTPGAMTAVICPREQLQSVISELKTDLHIANYNSPEQTVLSGSMDAIKQAEQKLLQSKVNFVRLPVNTGFHSPMVSDTREPFLSFLGDIPLSKARIPVIACTGKPAPLTANALRKYLAQQISNPVYFEQQVEHLYDMGIRNFVEIGPANALSKLVDSCLGNRAHRSIALDKKSQHGVYSLFHAMAQMTMAGLPVQWKNLWQGYVTPQTAANGKPKLCQPINGSSVNHPFPPKDDAPLHPPMDFSNIQTPAAIEAGNKIPGMSPSDTSAEAATQRSTTQSSATQSPATQSPTTASAQQRDVANIIEKLSQAQNSYQQSVSALQHSMTQAHQSYLKTMESLLTDTRPDNGNKQEATETELVATQRLTQRSTQADKPAQADTQRSVERSSIGNNPLPLTPAPARVASATQTVSTPAQDGKSEKLPQDKKLSELFLNVVADKTGYPRDILQLDMDMESSLGIDSIKRVEILSEMQQQLPHIGELDTSELSELNTLGQVLQSIETAAGELSTDSGESNKTPAQAGVNQANITEIFLKVVAEKTGYPRDILQLDMEMESGLGIDSIKRVEILAEMQQQLPHLNDMDTSTLAESGTLGEVLHAIEQIQAESLPPAQALASRASSSTPITYDDPAPEPAGILDEIQEIFLQVVADKTGYPRNILQGDMEMESGLGIDSIKRVEILSEMQQRLPQLDQMDPSELASAQTINDVINFIHSSYTTPSKKNLKLPQSASEANQDCGANTVYHRQAPYKKSTPPSMLPIPGLYTPGPIAICQDNSGLATLLAKQLSKAGLDVIVVNTKQELPRKFIGLVYLEALNPSKTARDGIDTITSAFSWLKAAAATLRAGKGFVLLLQNTGGSLAVNAPNKVNITSWSGGLRALGRTVNIEWPEVYCRTVDYACKGVSQLSIAKRITEEMIFGGLDKEVALTEEPTSRFTLVDKPAPIDEVQKLHDLPLKQNDVVLVTGGARGVTSSCIQALASCLNLRFAILGRTKLEAEPEVCQGIDDEASLIKALLDSNPQKKSSDLMATKKQVADILAGRNIQQTLSNLNHHGSQAHYYDVDITDQSAVNTVCESVQSEWGPIKGIIHAAGILADKAMEAKTEESFRAVLKTKLIGLENVLTSCQEDLSILCLFSSVAARYGNRGQSDYAAANETLNQIALSVAEQRPNCLVKSIMWGPWEGGMVSAGLKAHFQAMGIPLIPLNVGSQWFVQELQSGNQLVNVIAAEAANLSIPAINGDNARSKCFQYTVCVNQHNYPQLLDHKIDGKVVVPVVQVIEWFRSIAMHHLQTNVALENIEVLSGICIEHFKSNNIFLIELQQLNPERCRLELFDSKKRIRYRATSITDNTDDVDITIASFTPEQAHWPIAKKQIYSRNTLFHGPRFQIIHATRQYGQNGAELTINTSREQAWQGISHSNLLSVIEGGLQLPILWSHCNSDFRALPTKIQRIRWHQNIAPEKALCQAWIQKDASTMSANVIAYDEQKKPLLTLEGAQFCFIPIPSTVTVA